MGEGTSISSVLHSQRGFGLGNHEGGVLLLVFLCRLGIKIPLPMDLEPTDCFQRVSVVLTYHSSFPPDDPRTARSLLPFMFLSLHLLVGTRWFNKYYHLLIPHQKELHWNFFPPRNMCNTQNWALILKASSNRCI